MKRNEEKMEEKKKKMEMEMESKKVVFYFNRSIDWFIDLLIIKTKKKEF